MNFNDLIESTVAQFVRQFRRQPEWIAAAPGRVNLMGGHVDYNDGCVLPMAIERYTVVAGSPVENSGAASPRATFVSAQFDESVSIDLSQPINRGDAVWFNYVQGVVAGFTSLGLAIPSFEALIHSSVPIGSGLSSSAALEVAVATFLEAVLGMTLDKSDKALLCQKAEHEFAGVPCGIMDQFASVYGQKDALIMLDCRSRVVQPIPLSTDEVSILITNSNAPRQLVAGEYATRRKQCQDAAKILGVGSLRNVTLDVLEARRKELSATHFKRARHVVTEIARTARTAEAMRRRDWEFAGQQFYASQNSLREDYQVSCPQLDLLVDLAREIGVAGGVFGARLTGAGFGGCTVTLISKEASAAVIETIHTKYVAQMGTEPTLFVSRPAQGAHLVKSFAH